MTLVPVKKQQISARAWGDPAPVIQPHRSCWVLGHQLPQRMQRGDTVGQQPRDSTQQRGVGVVGGKKIAMAARHHLGGTGAAKMAITAHRVRRAKIVWVSRRAGRQKYPFVHREFGHPGLHAVNDIRQC